MIGRTATSCRQQRAAGRIAKAFGFSLPVMAVILACCISFFSKMPIPIKKPAILMLGALIILVPFGPEVTTTLQRIVGFYLVSVPINELSPQYFSIPATDARVSYSAIILLLCTIGFCLGRIDSGNAPQEAARANIIHGWVLALAIIVAHMMVLSLLLNKFYGYGYERNLSVLGNLALYLLLFVFLWKRLGELRFRQCVGLIMAIFYLAVTFAKHRP